MEQKANKYQTGELEHAHAERGQAFKQLEHMCDPHTPYYAQACLHSDTRRGSGSIECVQRQGFISLFHKKYASITFPTTLHLACCNTSSSRTTKNFI
jgi:hypothetical protein